MKISKKCQLSAAILLLIFVSSSLSLAEEVKGECSSDAGDESCSFKEPSGVYGSEHPRELSNDENYYGCRIWIAESSIEGAGLGVYSGAAIKSGQMVGEPDIVIPLVDPDKRIWSPIHEYTWNGELLDDMFFENSFVAEGFSPGLGAQPNCHMGLNNIRMSLTSSTDNSGLHRSRDPAVGSFSQRYNYAKVAEKDISAGEEIFINYGEHWFEERENLLGVIPFQDDFERSDRIGSKIWRDSDTLPTDIWDMIYNISEPRLQKTLPKKATYYKEIMSNYNGSTARASCPNSIRSLQWLKENGYCVDRLYAAKSTIPDAGRGAFAKSAVNEGEIVTISPVIHFGRDQIPIKEQYRDMNDEHMFSTNTRELQLLLNYAFSRDDSDVFLAPYAPVVNFINHNTRGPPNVAIRWSSSKYHQQKFLKLSSTQLLKKKSGLMIEYVALRKIEKDEEIFIDYGESWVNAWKEHLENFEPSNDSNNYVASFEFSSLHGNEPIRTLEEQQTNPYPSSLQTACYYAVNHDPTVYKFIKETGTVEIQTNWISSPPDSECLFPCSVLSRSSNSQERNKRKIYSLNSQPEQYTVEVAPLTNEYLPFPCLMGKNERHIVSNIPRNKIKMVNKEHTSDIHIPHAFRYHINAPEGMFPDAWSRRNNTNMTVLSENMAPGQIDKMKLMESGEEFANFAYTLGLPTKITETLLEYCNKMGITDRFRQLLYTKAHEPSVGTFETFNELEWFVQRPHDYWNSDMHWISPANAEAHDDYLRVLGEAGFDEILDIIGKNFAWEGLVCFHVTFIGVSQCEDGYVHYDFHDTGGKGFNIIMPLILVNGSKPELDMHSDDGESFVGSYKYRHNIAPLMGDNAFHATSAINYTSAKEFRMAATVYVADVHEWNVNNIA